MRTDSAETRSTMARGVAAGSNMPNQPMGSKPVSPCSFSVGTSGSQASRLGPVVPSSLNLGRCGRDEPASRNADES